MTDEVDPDEGEDIRPEDVEPEAPEGYVIDGPEDPVLPQNVLDFPEFHIRWPIPIEVAYALELRMITKANEAIITALQGAYQRVSQIHEMVPSTETSPAFCIECGKKSGYPCPTLVATLGEDSK